MAKPNKQTVALPDMAAFVREVTEYGNIGAIVRRISRLSPAKAITLMWWNKGNLLTLARKDFSAGMVLLLQIALLQQPDRVREVLIVHQVVDLAVALHNTQLLEALVFAVRRSRRTPVLVTNNLPRAVRVVAASKIKGVKWSFPRNKWGYEMNPSKEDVEKYAKMLEPESVYGVI